MVQDEITIDKRYIIEKIINGEVKRQYAYIDEKYEYEGKIYYEYTYGHFGFHEGSCEFENIKELTEEQKVYSEVGQFWKLPQQFYQSFPE